MTLYRFRSISPSLGVPRGNCIQKYKNAYEVNFLTLTIRVGGVRRARGGLK